MWTGGSVFKTYGIQDIDLRFKFRLIVLAVVAREFLFPFPGAGRGRDKVFRLGLTRTEIQFI